MAVSEANAAPLARLLELRLAEIDRAQRGECAEVERRATRRDQLRRTFLSLIEESDYAELNGSSLVREIGGIFSLDRAALHAVYDVQHLRQSIRESPHDPLPYVELAEAHQAMARADAVRAGIRGVVSPWSLLTRGAVEVYRNWTELPKQEIVLARRAVALSATQLRCDPRDVEALEAYGRARLLLGDAQGAAKSLKAALVLRPARHSLYFHLSRAYSVTERSRIALRYAVMGARVGCPRCLALLDDSLAGMATEKGGEPPFAGDVRTRRQRAERAEAEAVPSQGAVAQFVDEKKRALRALALRAERSIDGWGVAPND